MTAYVPLWVKSNHSFLEGASHPEELVERAHALGLRTLALTDRDSVGGIVYAHQKARALGVELIVGAEVTVGVNHRVVLLARTRKGYGDLCELISKGRQRCAKGSSSVRREELCLAAGDLVALVSDAELIEPLHAAFGADLYALVARHLRAEEISPEVKLLEAALFHRIPVVAATEVLYHDRSRRDLQDVLTCIRVRCTLSTAGTALRANAEYALKSFDEMGELFRDRPDALAQSVEIAKRCTFRMNEIRYRYPGERLPDGVSEEDWLRTLTYRGAHVRYGLDIPRDVEAQLERELSLIRELDYGGYFLTMYEIVQFCRAQSILCQGRGSAANSAVCYCLGVTAVDPVRMELLFERFLSRERAEPPDIDLDIEHERREEVIQHVYEKYGRRHAAMVANVIRYRARSAVRDVGKVLDFTPTEIDALARLVGHYESAVDEPTLASAGLTTERARIEHWVRLTAEIQDFPRHLSIHPGGFILGHEPVDRLVPIEPGTMEGRTVIQWDKDSVEGLGLFKVDLLGLGALSCVHRALDLLRRHDGLDLNMATVPANDAETFAMTSRGDTVGVFQIESRAQMSMLPRLKPRTFYDLVIQIAIVRPGPIQGDMVHPYLRRRTGEEPVEYPHSSLEKVLRRTLGVPIFQEQVMKLAILAADYTPGEADQLRRDMAAWRSKGRIEAHHDRLVTRMVERGIPIEFAERVFSQIRGFGEYGFPESHAASFALIAYVTAWLRCHHLPAFVCALLNSQPMGFYSASTLVEDARRHGVVIRPIDVNRSAWDCTLEPSPRSPHPYALRMGLRYVKGLGKIDRERIEAVLRPQPSLASFVRTTRLSRRSLASLAQAGALRSFKLSRRDALWAVRGLGAHASDPLPLEPAAIDTTFAQLDSGEAIRWDYRTSAHSSLGHPMLCVRAVLTAQGFPEADVVRAARHGQRMRYVGVVICRQRPGTESGVTFFTLEDETGFVNAVVWKDVFDRYRTLAKTASLLGIEGRIQNQEGVVHIVAERLFAPSLETHSNTEPLRSRDFH